MLLHPPPHPAHQTATVTRRQRHNFRQRHQLVLVRWVGSFCFHCVLLIFAQLDWTPHANTYNTKFSTNQEGYMQHIIRNHGRKALAEMDPLVL